MVKSKLCLHSGSAALRQLNPSIKMGHDFFLVDMRLLCYFTRLVVVEDS